MLTTEATPATLETLAQQERSSTKIGTAATSEILATAGSKNNDRTETPAIEETNYMHGG
jgi:hypothetical protein